MRATRQEEGVSPRERIERLRSAFTHKDKEAYQNIVRWQDYNPYLEWAEGSEADFSRGLTGLWQPETSAEERIRAFLGALPGTVVKSPSSRLTLASFLLLGVDAGRWPPCRYRPFERLLKLTGTDSALKVGDEAETYRNALVLMDRFLEACRRGGLEPRDRLDAQGLVWAVTHWWPPPADWSASDRAAFAKFIGRSLPPDRGGNKDNGGSRLPAARRWASPETFSCSAP